MVVKQLAGARAFLGPEGIELNFVVRVEEHDFQFLVGVAGCIEKGEVGVYPD